MIKNAKDAGADELTPSVPQYFSWINNTNEGSTEGQTLINLDFFRYMKETYGMEIRIYAWDAGNFDGASEGYGDLNSDKFRAQYPDGYRKVVEKAASMGIHMGLWGSPDGYGDDEKTERERFDFYVHLCRDYGFEEFKLDGVCGRLRPEKASLFADMLKECRKYSPKLIVLNHRLDLYEAEKHVTTFLWNGQETYVDVLSANNITAMHNRAFMFSRGHVEGLQRLAEDHGVCISSSIDYFEDELIYQAFNRSLILAPEMYGNPWFMRDDELPKLARVYNLHKRVAPILVQGMLLGEEYGCEACSRGSGTKRFISTGNDTWETKTVTLRLDDSIGLEKCKNVAVNIRHPYESHLGVFAYGDTVDIELPAFRAVLVEAAVPEEAEPVLTNCEYEVVTENENGAPDKIKLLKTAGGEVMLLHGGKTEFFCTAEATDIREASPLYLGTLNETEEFPENGEELYEAAVFAADNDALEARSRHRSGDTAIPEVKACRDAFFSQKTYRLRGCEASALFDGKDDTFFDAQSKSYCGGLRASGGCLRVDFGKEIEADGVEIEFFAAQHPTKEVPLQNVPVFAEYAVDYKNWKTSGAVRTETVREEDAEIVKFRVHTTYMLRGNRIRAYYPVAGALRFLRLAEPMDRIYAVRLIANGREVPVLGAKANNMQAHYSKRPVEVLKTGVITLPRYKPGSRLAVAFNGEHGEECAYCAAEIDGELTGFPMRAPDYLSNVWEHCVCSTDRNNTFFLPLPDGAENKTLKIYALLCDNDHVPEKIDVYLCEKH